jgi:NADPH:quinone reductase-like Zn-dependent oxidoreductase
VFRYEDVPDPTRGRDGAIEVKATASRAAHATAPAAMTSRPHIVGYQCAGIVRAVGDVVRGRASASASSGMTADRMPSWSRSRRGDVGDPDGVDLEHGACVPICSAPLTTASSSSAGCAAADH